MDRTRAFSSRRRLERLIFRFVNRDFKVKEAIDLDMGERWKRWLNVCESVNIWMSMRIYWNKCLYMGEYANILE